MEEPVRNDMLKEYEFLKLELQSKTDAHHKLVMFAITTTVAILALEFTKPHPLITLLPFLVLIPVSMRINYLRNSISKISAYLVVYIENSLDGLNWETRNMDLFSSRKTINVALPTSPSNMKNWECFLLGLVSCCMYLWSLSRDCTKELATHLAENWWLIIPLIILFTLTILPSTPDKQRMFWVEKWRCLQCGRQLNQKNSNELDALLVLYLGQILAVVFYAALEIPVINFFSLPDYFVSPIQSIAYWATIYFWVKLFKNKIRTAYGTLGTEAVLSVQLLGIAITFFVCGLFGKESCAELAGITFGLFLGNFVSLKNIIETDETHPLWKNIIKIYIDSGINQKSFWKIGFFTVATSIVNASVILIL